MVVADHDDVIKWKHFQRYWPFVWGIHRSPVNSPHKGQWRGALMFSFICGWINGWANNRKAGDLRRYRGHYDGFVMWTEASNNGYAMFTLLWSLWTWIESTHCSLVTQHWRYKSGLILVQIIAWCLTAPSHCQKQCWLIIKRFCGIHVGAISNKVPQLIFCIMSLKLYL